MQLPQWVASEETQAPLQERSPPAHWHEPLWQVMPLPQTVPQEPQFWGSVWALTHCCPQEVWPEPQLGPTASGFAQLVARSAETRATPTAAKKELGFVMIDFLIARG